MLWSLEIGLLSMSCHVLFAKGAEESEAKQMLVGAERRYSGPSVRKFTMCSSAIEHGLCPIAATSRLGLCSSLFIAPQQPYKA
jgi:hypothetical protein